MIIKVNSHVAKVATCELLYYTSIAGGSEMRNGAQEMDQSTRARVRAKRAGNAGRVDVGSGKVQYSLYSQVQRLFGLCSIHEWMPACGMDGFFNN